MKDGLIVTGSGRAWAPPDRAAINLGFSAINPQAGGALTLVNEKLDELIVVLKDLGVPGSALRTTDLSLWGETDRNGAPAGYRARNTLRIELDEVGRVGEVLKTGLDMLGDGAEMNGIEFSLQDPSAVETTARARAYEAAVAKANQLAELAGRGLGPVLSIAETLGRGGGEPRPMAKLALAESVPVEPGTTSVVVTLTVRFALVG